jgi:carbamoyl-phosphate synthase large subunit
MKARFLITGANGDIGTAIGRILRSSWPDAVVEGADCAGDWPGGFIFQRMHALPLARDPAYPEELTRLGANYDLVIPSSEPELARLADNSQAATGLPLLMVRPDLLTCFLDKLNTAHWLEANGCTPPHSKPLEEATEADLPLLIKPRRGAGGRGQEIIRTPARLALAKAEAPPGMVAQELLEVEDQEYTCALFAHEGDIRSVILRRWLVGGHTGKAELTEKAAVTELLKRIAVAAQLEGCINVQLRLTEAGPRVFEINPRLSSTVVMRHLLGFQDLLWWIEARLNGSPSPMGPLPPVGTMIHRLSDERVVLST